ncbi:MAG: DUF2914 domain-containing protein [Deltaproteobacteria bacterium]|nr:DUF2914 domain-containing protein [Deltaproteobacteria bacterium]
MSGRWSSLLSRLERVQPALPWLSLATGVGGALLMNRTPERAWVVVIAALLAWALLVGLHLWERVLTERARRAGVASLRDRGARFALLLTSQLSVQQALLFPLPFYLRAVTWHVGHVVFLVVYAAALVAALWDPLYAAVTKRALTSFPLFSFAIFAGLAVVLPMLGLSNRLALIVAGAATTVGVPALLWLRAGSRWLRIGAVCAALPAAGLSLVAAPLVPPAPLELVTAAIGTGVVERELVGAGAPLLHPIELYCHTAVKAPLGLHDGLFHVWTRDGKLLDRVALDVRGGRADGFRTWSKKRTPGPGDYRCQVQTASGQVLGGTDAAVRATAPPPAAAPR